MPRRLTPIFLALALLAAPGPLFAFGEAGCGAGQCIDCHSLSVEKVKEVLSPLGVDDVERVEMSTVPGLWAVDVVSRGRKIPVYLDFSLRYLIQGDVVEIATQESETRNREASLNRVDASHIPLDDALVVGDPKAAHKIILFDDPVCPYCKKLQPELARVVKMRPDVAFFIKLLPLVDLHPDAYDKAKAILCEKSLALLEKSLAGEELPPPSCETDQLEENKKLAVKLNVRSTPTLIFPDGRVYPGYRSAEKILSLLDAGGGKQ